MGHFLALAVAIQFLKTRHWPVFYFSWRQMINFIARKKSQITYQTLQIDPFSIFLLEGEATSSMNECLLTLAKAVGLLPSFGSGHYLTAIMNHDWVNFVLPNFSQGLESAKVPTTLDDRCIWTPTLTRWTIMD